MTVEELIKRLSEFPPKMKVAVPEPMGEDRRVLISEADWVEVKNTTTNEEFVYISFF